MNDTARPSGLRLWLAGARPRTLPAAVVPVAVGSAVAVGQGADTAWWRAGAALVVAVALQVGVNYANDYSDGIRGTDGGDRVGPLRLVGSGTVAAPLVKRAATVSFAVAGLVGAVLALAVGPELFVVGAAALVAGWSYTGGPRPYGYLGLGEVFVFVFFGLVATVGTTYVLLERIDGVSVACRVAVGLWSAALLVVNNLRDIPGDTVAGKRTLAVRIGDRATRAVYVVMIDATYFVAVGVTLLTGRGAALAIVGIPFAVGALHDIVDGAEGPALIGVLSATGRTQLVSGTAMAVGLALTP